MGAALTCQPCVCRYALDEPSFKRLSAGKEQVRVLRIHHRLPCALVSGKRMEAFVQAATDAAGAAGSLYDLEILKCVKMNADQYLKPNKTLDVQSKWDFSRYASAESKDNKSYNRRNPPPAHLENRLLLFAETQIGKTGAFIHFLLNCIQERAV